MVGKNRYPSDAADRFIVRFRDKKTRPLIKRLAAENHRSMNSEILHLLEFALSAVHKKENAPEGRSSEAPISKTEVSIKESDND